MTDGEIRARGPQMLVGYLHPEDETAAFDDDGFFRTGDLGRWEDDEFLVVTGRAKDIIIRNGENISPKEIEDILVGHAGIAEIAVVGVPDERTGERACAVIVASAQPSPDLAGLRDLLMREGVAKFKVPEQVEIWEALPKNDAGKVLKHQIRATADEGGCVMQVAIVTGASSGIGFGCATKLADMGMAVVGTGRDAGRLAELEKTIGDRTASRPSPST